MQIMVDNQPYQVREADTQSIQQLADEVCGSMPGEGGRLVVGLACDGEPVQPDQLEHLLCRPIGSFASIEMQTVSVREQVNLTLDQAIEILEGADQLREQAADDLNQGRHESAMSGLQRLLEIFKQVQQTTVLASHLLGTPLESINIEGQDLAGVLTGIKERLNDLKTGMENQDFVAVSDILRYEFTGPIEAWRAILAHLREAG
jgi:hypothetical protein